ncbi:MAG: GNAT family N-acetyltransferase [Lachnospiraceae bacterium]|nr:GNAT family N-acetyltransferase [Lachnospiraceae bacterium]
MLLNNNLETSRLIIRSWKRTDTDFTLNLWGDRENGKYMSDPARENQDEDYLQAVAEMEDNPNGYYLIAVLKEDGTKVGTCCAFPENGNYDIGYCISKDHWKEGLGTEMIGALINWIKENGGETLTGEVADANLASIALLRKLGFSEDRKSRYKKWGEETDFDAHYYKLIIGG